MSLLTPLIPHVLGRVLNTGTPSLNLGKRVLGGILLISGLGLGAFILYKFLIPLFGDLISGLIMSGIFLGTGGILWCSKPSTAPFSPQEILSKAENVVENLHLPANFEKHTGKFLGTALGAGIILAYLLSHKKE
ncbi:hypothetical protein [Candidatus Odyssella acanthamoebae]|uniref:Uncharacterized protein n=1 Tax=Candidatus Odyssella acanthamoebae TaxID=91604 RepID=A0A077AVX5_9PROT|nr:hypothetical protein [Candidatus Paracaedibacter acanthamoebae]AIK97307.1 hypothetical protein ID47_12040 [Candidatus Paracaedibacter acanthamoebae]